ncbi:MAG: SDR family oxidoreductase [Cytophagaceae bacterium]|nr:SDR family oxidoreductase [Cytophagaceae bacterium]
MNNRTIVITGSQTGMGLSTRKLLESIGIRVIGVSNTPDAEIEADLSTEEGVRFAIEQITIISEGSIDGVFANAGVDSENARLVFGLNYFGIVQLLEGLQPLLKKSKHARVVINASNSVVITPNIPTAPVDALLNNDVNGALNHIRECPEYTYQVSKTAITKWMRQQAGMPNWAGSGISMNAIAPGVVLTALLEKDMQDPRKAAGINSLPKPLGAHALPEDIADLVKFLLVDNARFMIGQYIVIDGGAEVTWRANDAPVLWKR